MKFIAKYKGYTIHNQVLRPILNCELYNLESITKLQENTDVIVEIKKKTKSRSLTQNAYLWALIGEIAKFENGDLQDEDDIYKNLIKMAGARTDTLIIKTDAVESFVSNFRAYEVLGEQVVKGEAYSTIRVYYGSSQLDTKEMGNLIDTTLKYADEVGISTDYWKGLLC